MLFIMEEGRGGKEAWEERERELETRSGRLPPRFGSFGAKPS
jgi:hypothetical protein